MDPDEDADETLSDSDINLRDFFEAHSPFKWRENELGGFVHKPVHLLHCLHHLIVNLFKASKIAGVMFATTKGGIKDVKFDGKTCTLQLLEITLNNNSQFIVRNLDGSTLEVAE
ncbi:unnamed protein product [Ilex paraguariensis]|uniref:Uncharacterized protein n=1 Tax=Ilex paraguariensis TaxID=185542 RepID=A0ABC8QP27_9AQUA